MKTNLHMKRGFGLISAMIFIVVLATIGALALSMSTKSAAQATNTYLKEQAEVLAANATEFAVMAMQMHDYGDNDQKGCINNITLWYPDNTQPMFQMNVALKYLNKSLPNSCTKADGAVAIEVGDTSAHAAIIEVEVVSIDQDPQIRYFLRSVQKP